MNCEMDTAAGCKPALSVVEMERVLLAAAQNFPETRDVRDVSVEVRHGDWFVTSHALGRNGAADSRMTDVVDSLRRVFRVRG
jgi:hypothetical protein